jgi:hypothetical protein
VLDRNRYFTGKYMRARDFQVDQDYFLSRSRLHNRLLHGWGIVCGLGVEVVHEKGCPPELIVHPGVAVDCCGRELVLEQPHQRQIVLPDLTRSPSSRASDGVPEPWLAARCGDPTELPTLLVCLEYRETESEPVPVLGECGGCAPGEVEGNRVTEGVSVVLRAEEDLAAECWPDGGSANHGASLHDGTSGPGCIEPSCVCGDCVPLALISVESGKHGDGPRIVVHTEGRRELAGSAEQYTRITDISWPHGGTLSIDELAGAGGELRVTFERPLEAADGDATGINRHTFEVQHLSENRFRALVKTTSNSPRVVDDCVAVFTIDDEFLYPDVGSPVGSVVYVTLYGDLVLDVRGKPVDVDHLRGSLPSGDGSPGGTFRSWFTIVDSHGKVTP